MRNVPHLLESEMTTGRYNYLITVHVKDMVDYWRLLAQSLVSLTSVHGTHTYVVMEEVKSTTLIFVTV